MTMNKAFQLIEYVGFSVLISAFVVGFSDAPTPEYFIPKTSLLGILLVAWGVGGQE